MDFGTVMHNADPWWKCNDEGATKLQHRYLASHITIRDASIMIEHKSHNLQLQVIKYELLRDHCRLMK